MAPSYLTPALLSLRAAFQAAGFDIRLVGGCVRDTLRGQTPKDIDLCTDATPDQQMAVYAENHFRYVTTGLQHGTITVVLGGEPFEITSLRTETDHDGRHAVVSYHGDWELDQMRRDLTINSMMMDFDGNLFDPFEGKADLENGVVRFVGDAGARMREDYLRILRWFRFLARFGNVMSIDDETVDAVVLNAHGLKKISKERVWSEMSKIVVGASGGYMLREMMRMGVAHHIGLSHGSWRDVVALEGVVKDPVAIMVAFTVDPEQVRALSTLWRFSTAEAKRAAWLADNLHSVDFSTGYRDMTDLKRYLAFDRIDRHWVAQLALLQHRTYLYGDVLAWEIPECPVKGQDLLDAGHKPGPMVGQMVGLLRNLWADSDYTMTREELLEKAPVA
jgi:tRNA nucleotidyltransferase (CCA-adding enzyme)